MTKKGVYFSYILGPIDDETVAADGSGVRLSWSP